MAENGQKAVIFDLDGVLIDTAEYHKQAFFDLAHKENLPMSEEFFYNEIFGSQNSQIMPKLLGRALATEEIARLADWKEARYRELVDGKLQLLDGAGQLIKSLKDAGFKLAIGTSTPRINLEFLFEHMPLHDYFDATVAGEEARRSKPAPDTFVTAAAKLGLGPGRCVVVEDAVQGVAAARAGGMKVVAVTTARTRAELGQADMVVDSLAELSPGDFIGLLAG